MKHCIPNQYSHPKTNQPSRPDETHHYQNYRKECDIVPSIRIQDVYKKFFHRLILERTAIWLISKGGTLSYNGLFLMVNIKF